VSLIRQHQWCKRRLNCCVNKINCLEQLTFSTNRKSSVSGVHRGDVNSKAARRISRDLWPMVRRKLDQIDAVRGLPIRRYRPGTGCARSEVTFEDCTRYECPINIGPPTRGAHRLGPRRSG
jgi:hypothetical protein